MPKAHFLITQLREVAVLSIERGQQKLQMDRATQTHFEWVGPWKTCTARYPPVCTCVVFGPFNVDASKNGIPFESNEISILFYQPEFFGEQRFIYPCFQTLLIYYVQHPG